MLEEPDDDALQNSKDFVAQMASDGNFPRAAKLSVDTMGEAGEAEVR